VERFVTLICSQMQTSVILTRFGYGETIMGNYASEEAVISLKRVPL